MEELGSDHLVLPIILTKPTSSVHSFALVNSGSSTISFMNANFAALYRFPI